MGARQFRLTLKSGPDNIRKFPEGPTQTFKRGELVSLTGTKAAVTVTIATTASFSSGILGVAAKDGQGVATPPEKAEVYVVTPEQVWELHAAADKKPNTNYTLGHNYKVLQVANTGFTMTREDDTASTTVSMRGPVLGTTDATNATGLVLVGYHDATKAKKGQKVLVRFGVDSGIFQT